MFFDISIYNHGRGTGARNDRGTSRKTVHGVPKTRPEKSAFLAGSGAPSGFQNRGKKVRKTNQGPPAVMGEEKRRKRSVNERRHIDKLGFSYRRGCENQEERVLNLDEKKLGKGVISQTGRNRMKMRCKSYPELVLQIGTENASQMTSPRVQIGLHI